jgi:hypothetical protein
MEQTIERLLVEVNAGQEQIRTDMKANQDKRHVYKRWRLA